MEPCDEVSRPQRSRLPQSPRSRLAQFAHNPWRGRGCGFAGGHAFPGRRPPAARYQPPGQERPLRLHLVTPKTNLRGPGGGPPATRTPDAKARLLDAEARAEI